MRARDRGLVAVLTDTNLVRSLRSEVYAENLNILNETLVDKLFSSHKEHSTESFVPIEVRTWSPSLRIAQNVRIAVGNIIF